jgi:hypothetical protein
MKKPEPLLKTKGQIAKALGVLFLFLFDSVASAKPASHGWCARDSDNYLSSGVERVGIPQLQNGRAAMHTGQCIRPKGMEAGARREARRAENAAPYSIGSRNARPAEFISGESARSGEQSGAGTQKSRCEIGRTTDAGSTPASSTPFRITLEGLRPIDDFEGHRYTPAQWAKHDDEAQQLKDAGN